MAWKLLPRFFQEDKRLQIQLAGEPAVDLDRVHSGTGSSYDENGRSLTEIKRSVVLRVDDELAYARATAGRYSMSVVERMQAIAEREDRKLSQSLEEVDALKALGKRVRGET